MRLYSGFEMTEGEIFSFGATVIRAEASALLRLAEELTPTFDEVVHLILSRHGKLVITGIGKSGHVARKIAATFASTGTPAFFVHPAEASHGDLGMIDGQDTVIAISKSGESPELSNIVSHCRRHGIPLIAITAVAASSLGTLAQHLLRLPDVPEACPLNLAPTTSTTMALALGDALAIACLRQRDFRASNFRDLHPGGKLGLMLIRVRDLMHTGEELPLVNDTATVGATILEMTRGRLGCVGVVDADGRLVGIFTDGDLRRQFSAALIDKPIQSVMIRDPLQMNPESLIADVGHLFTSKRVPSVFACEDGKPLGIVHLHDLLRNGLI